MKNISAAVENGGSIGASLACGLCYVTDDDPGIRRRRAGRGYSYRQPDGQIVTDRGALERLRKLAIPPAYHDVWICPDPMGHIQATARDARGRKQYLYHDTWRSMRDEAKFARMIDFGRALPKIRLQVALDAGARGLTHRKMTAVVVQLVERTLIRVGNDQYVKANKSFGLTTLRNQHVKIDGEDICFQFRGKSGVMHRLDLRDRRLARVLRACQELPGQRLFQYADPDGAAHPLGSGDVNAYLHDIAGETFTAKDFRTWAGTLQAARSLAQYAPPASAAEAKRGITQGVKIVAGLLGNTPAVCRASYIHPAILQAYADGLLPATFRDAEEVTLEPALLAFLASLSTGPAQGVAV